MERWRLYVRVSREKVGKLAEVSLNLSSHLEKKIHDLANIFRSVSMGKLTFTS